MQISCIALLLSLEYILTYAFFIYLILVIGIFPLACIWDPVKEQRYLVSVFFQLHILIIIWANWLYS